jgi:hypothetical protein
MYNETYDEYIRSILGYPSHGPQEYQDYQEYRNPTFNTNINISGNNVELENSYPEIYKIVYPMVAKKCDNMRGEAITKDDIQNMTDEIYYALETKNETRVNINLTNDVSTKNITRTESRRPDVKISETKGDNSEKRQINSGLRDLIQILLIRELLNRRRPPFRPPMPNPPGPGPRPPMRPPFRPGPGRPPFNRDLGSFSDLYEQF